MRLRSSGLALAAVALAGASLPAAAAADTLVVTPGHSIQKAVDRAGDGDKVLVHPGTYKEAGRACPTEPARRCAVVVRKDSIRLVGAPEGKHHVVLAAQGNQYQGIAVARTGNASCLQDASKRIEGSLVKGFEVRDFAHDGLFLFCVDGWRVTGVRALGNDEYGIFPSHSGKGQVDHSFARGANDTGIYIGQSHDVRITRNVATKNVSGFEIENSVRVRADHNTARRNTAGMLSFALPSLDVKVNDHNLVDHNNVYDNNKANTCPDPGDIVCDVPAGSGILVVAADHNRVEDNAVIANDTVGIGVANYCIITGASSTHCTNDIDPAPDHDRVRFNDALQNGHHPAPQYAVFASDLGWDTTGTGNCWSGNTFDKSFPSSLPAC